MCVWCDERKAHAPFQFPLLHHHHPSFIPRHLQGDPQNSIPAVHGCGKCFTGGGWRVNITVSHELYLYEEVQTGWKTDNVPECAEWGLWTVFLITCGWSVFSGLKSILIQPLGGGAGVSVTHTSAPTHAIMFQGSNHCKPGGVIGVGGYERWYRAPYIRLTVRRLLTSGWSVATARKTMWPTQIQLLRRLNKAHSCGGKWCLFCSMSHSCPSLMSDVSIFSSRIKLRRIPNCDWFSGVD